MFISKIMFSFHTVMENEEEFSWASGTGILFRQPGRIRSFFGPPLNLSAIKISITVPIYPFWNRGDPASTSCWAPSLWSICAFCFLPSPCSCSPICKAGKLQKIPTKTMQKIFPFSSKGQRHPFVPGSGNHRQIPISDQPDVSGMIPQFTSAIKRNNEKKKRKGIKKNCFSCFYMILPQHFSSS